MAEVLDKTSADIPVLHEARQKFDDCSNKDIFYNIGYCKLFHYTFDGTFDMLHHCGSCKANTSKPSTMRKDVRFF